MNRCKNFTEWILKKLFPDVLQRDRQRITVQIITGVILAVVSIAGMGICHYRAEKQILKYQKIAETYTQTDSAQKEGITKAKKKAAEELKKIIPKLKEEDRQEDAEVRRETITISYDWDGLQSINPNIKGWLYIPGSLINFPVTGTTDNDFYLTHDFAGDKSRAGCPFMDKDTEMWDFNRVIYGHNMGSGSDAMFSTLLKYEQEDYFNENRTIFFTDAYGSTTAYQVMAVVKYNIEDIGEWDFRTRNHKDMESYNVWMELLQERALYYLEPNYAPTSILTLSTCDRREFGKKGRFLVIAGNTDQ